jgi:hypothetical protein
MILHGELEVFADFIALEESPVYMITTFGDAQRLEVDRHGQTLSHKIIYSGLNLKWQYSFSSETEILYTKVISGFGLRNQPQASSKPLFRVR